MIKTHAQAKALFKEKRARQRAFQDAYKTFQPAKDAWDKARMVSEIYKGQAIHFKERMGIVLQAYGFGNKRSVYCDYHNGNQPGIYVIVWNAKDTTTWVWNGSLVALKKRVREYIAVGKPMLPRRKK